MPLRLMIDNTAPDDLAPLPVHPSADFIQAAIRAAKHSAHTTRAKVIADVCEVLDCSKEDLAFLFAAKTEDASFHFPDYRREYVILEAAE